MSDLILVLFTTIIAPIISGVAVKLISCWLDKRK
ncbi:type I toxin-antitoxin system Fst family toxin [Lactococcus muris]|uniref:Type I toxin-antitoxin system Fst family toxin n=1 Tax=Lactococcus muris TaxID=2941330 RepID=A0ABV4DC73_9LACT|nr:MULTISPECIES: type I toxin-antitoxin system Fst family toxin [Lactococcus]